MDLDIRKMHSELIFYGIYRDRFLSKARYTHMFRVWLLTRTIDRCTTHTDDSWNIFDSFDSFANKLNESGSGSNGGGGGGLPIQHLWIPHEAKHIRIRINLPFDDWMIDRASNAIMANRLWWPQSSCYYYKPYTNTNTNGRRAHTCTHSPIGHSIIFQNKNKSMWQNANRSSKISKAVYTHSTILRWILLRKSTFRATYGVVAVVVVDDDECAGDGIACGDGGGCIGDDGFRLSLI